MVTTEYKSFFQRIKDGRGEKLSSCPYCGNTTEVYETPQGLVDCYRCGTAPVKTQTILRGEKAPGRDTREAITIQSEEPTLEQQCADLLREDQQRGEKGGGSSGSKGRKKTPKRFKSRVEQDSFGCGPQRDTSSVTRLCKMQRVELTMSYECRERLRELTWENRRNDGTLEPEITTIRRFLVAKKLTQLEAIPRLEYGAPKSKLQAKLTQVELKLLDRVANEFQVSRGEVIEAGIWAFFSES